MVVLKGGVVECRRVVFGLRDEVLFFLTYWSCFGLALRLLRR